MAATAHGLPAPLAMAAAGRLIAMDWPEGGTPPIRPNGQPDGAGTPVLPWDGERAVTLVTFRDMGVAGATRFKPIPLTAVAATIGAGAILFDPIFQGLAPALPSGLASSTPLTVLAVAAIYRVAST